VRAPGPIYFGSTVQHGKNLEARTPADLLIEARWVLPVLPDSVTFADGAIAVSSGRIVAVGARAELAARFEPAERIARPHHLVIPGLVNAHTHAAMTLFRGLPVRAPLFAWLKDSVWPAEARWMSPDLVRDGTRLAIAEMVRAGITTFADMYFFPEEAARVAAESHVRAAIGLPIAESAAPWAEDATACLARAERLWDEYRSDPWVSLHFAPHAPYSVSDDTLRRVQRVADELDARVAMHLHESEIEVRDSLAQHGVRPLQRLADRGLLRPGFSAVHMTQLTEDDLELVQRTGIAVIACPQSNLRLGNGITPLTELLARGINVGLGTDAPASCGALDLLAEARMAALLGRSGARTALRMATLGGAAALGLQQEIGSIEPGKAADLVCIDLSALECQPVGDAADAAVFGATRSYVSDVWIAGRAFVASGRSLAFDSEELRATAAQWQHRLRLEAAA
jgi:5-methylthioadenosine/S-adenosylhomocysteine deaminase